MKKKIKVAIAEFPPLIIGKRGRYKGFEIDLWEAIAKETGLDFEYEKCAFKEIIPLLAEKKVDIGLSGITITEKREKIIDFSHETLDSGLLICVNKDRNRLNIFETVRTILKDGSKTVRSAFFGILIFVLIAGNILWLVEKSAGTFNKHYFPGIFEAFWLTVISMSTVGYGDYFPHTWLGRILITVIIFGGAIIFGLLVAQTTTFLAIKKVRGEINSSRDLIGKNVAAIEGSTSENTLRKIGAKIRRVSDADQAMRELKNGSIDAAVMDAPEAVYHKNNDPKKKIEIVGELFDKQKYGIAFCQDSPLQEEINRAVLKLIESGKYASFYKKWFGNDLTMEV